MNFFIHRNISIFLLHAIKIENPEKRRIVTMSLIPCDDQCIYQKDGYCTLETPTVVTNHSGGCIHCIRPADKSQANANEPNITLPRLQTLL